MYYKLYHLILLLNLVVFSGCVSLPNDVDFQQEYTDSKSTKELSKILSNTLRGANGLSNLKRIGSSYRLKSGEYVPSSYIYYTIKPDGIYSETRSVSWPESHETVDPSSYKHYPFRKPVMRKAGYAHFDVSCCDGVNFRFYGSEKKEAIRVYWILSNLAEN